MLLLHHHKWLGVGQTTVIVVSYWIVSAVFALSQFLTESQKLSFHQAKGSLTIINNTTQWGLYWPLLLSPARKCYQLLVSELPYLSLFSRSFNCYQIKNLTEEFGREELHFFYWEICLLTSCWFVNLWSKEKLLIHCASFFYFFYGTCDCQLTLWNIPHSRNMTNFQQLVYLFFFFFCF